MSIIYVLFLIIQICLKRVKHTLEIHSYQYLFQGPAEEICLALCKERITQGQQNKICSIIFLCLHLSYSTEIISIIYLARLKMYELRQNLRLELSKHDLWISPSDKYCFPYNYPWSGSQNNSHCCFLEVRN